MAKKTLKSEIREGMLPEWYWLRPKAYADKIDFRAKKKVRRLMLGMLTENIGHKPNSAWFKQYMMDKVGFE